MMSVTFLIVECWMAHTHISHYDTLFNNFVD